MAAVIPIHSGMKTIKLFLILALLALGPTACDNEALKGTLKISITDAPIDSKNIKSVNIFFKNLEASQNGSWKSFKNFEQPVGVNLMSYTGGKSFLLIDQFTNPGEFQQLRMDLNIANRNSSLIVNPQSNIEFIDGSTQPIYMKEGLEPQLIVDAQFGIASRGLTDITLDLDLRKSIRKNDAGEFVLEPVIRVLNTFDTGSIRADVINTTTEKVVVYVYKQGAFKSSELQSGNGISFPNAISSASLANDKVQVGFLSSDSYDLIFVKLAEDGTVLDVLGKKQNVEVTKGNVNEIQVDISALSPS